MLSIGWPLITQPAISFRIMQFILRFLLSGAIPDLVALLLLFDTFKFTYKGPIILLLWKTLVVS